MSTLNVDEDAPEKETPPILMFRGDSTVRTGSLSSLSFGYPYDDPDCAGCLAGLYLGRCDRASGTTFEDGCELLLPFELENGWAKQSDLSDLVYRQPHESLLQSGVSPFNERHPFHLRALLEIVVRNVRAGEWSIDDHGVAEGIDIWEQADTEKWQSY